MFETLALRIENQRLKEKLFILCEEIGIDGVIINYSEIKNISEELNYYKKENEELIEIIMKLQNELNVYKYGKKD